MHIVGLAVGGMGHAVLTRIPHWSLLRHDPMIYLPVIFLIFFAVGWLVYPLIFRAVSESGTILSSWGLVFTFASPS